MQSRNIKGNSNKSEIYNAYNNIALVFVSLGERLDAIKIYKRIIEIEPNNIAAYNNWGIALYELGKTKKQLKNTKSN